MRVNISYSVELDDVPQEVDRILVECENKIRAIHEDLRRAIGQDPLTIIKEVDNVRLKMGATDLQLDDCMQILNGYVQTLAQMSPIQNGPAPPPASAPEEIQDE